MTSVSLDNKQTLQTVNSNIRWIDFIFSLLAFLGVIVGVYVSMEKTSTDHEGRLKNLEIQSQKFDAKVDKVLDKIETLTIITATQQAAIKQDRK